MLYNFALVSFRFTVKNRPNSLTGLNFAPIERGYGNFDNGFEISGLILGGVLVMLYYGIGPLYPTFRKREYAHHITVPPLGSGFAAPGGTQKLYKHCKIIQKFK